jgi:aminoglycoside phosphotransferase (APT) family kinase protein
MNQKTTQDEHEFSGASEVRMRFDVPALEAYMAQHVEGFKGPLTVEQFKGGQSNPTYRLTAASGRYVMRSKPGPAAKLLPSAHAIEREYRVMTSLAKVGFPVPKTFCLCEDESVLGRAFFIMDCMDGRILWDQGIPGVTNAVRGQMYDEMNRVIAQLHSVDYQAIGLGDFGKPGNYFARQIGRWSKQYRQSETQKMPAMDRLMEWLPENIPEGDETSIVHGDYRLDNMVFHPTEPRVIAVLDWELCTLGHPLADFSYHCISWHIPGGLFRGISELDLKALGIPDESAYVKAYCKRTGRDRIDNWDFYIAYNLFRLAAILQGIAKRSLDGTAASDRADDAGKRAGPLGEMGWKFAEKVIAAKK